MRVDLIFYTPFPEKVVTIAARLCYSDLTLDELRNEEVNRNLIRDVVRRGHHSVLEHCSFTFGIEDVSRVTTHQLVRHRIASYSQQSQRYVNLSKKGVSFVIPPTFFESQFKEEVEDLLNRSANLYKELIDSGISPEDARFVLPSSSKTRILVTMNARELLHFFSLRCCMRAQWEIREVANKMLSLVKGVAPTIFENAGPPCVSGRCPEGDRGCGMEKEMRSFYRNM